MNPSFLLFHCPSCTKEQLTHKTLSNDANASELIWACVECDTPVLDMSTAHWVDLAALGARDFLLDGQEIKVKESEGERGCRGGSCGVQQSF